MQLFILVCKVVNIVIVLCGLDESKGM